MAYSPRHIDVPTEHGVTRVAIRYTRPFVQHVRVQFCFLHENGIDHACDEWGCWPD